MPTCTGGPVMGRGGNQRGEKPYYPVRDYIAVSSYAGNEDFLTLLKKHAFMTENPKFPLLYQEPGVARVPEQAEYPPASR